MAERGRRGQARIGWAWRDKAGPGTAGTEDKGNRDNDREKTMAARAPTRPVPAVRQAAQPANPKPPQRRQVTFGPIEPRGHGILLFGPGGSGKSSLAAAAPEPVALIDLENSLPVLRSQLPAERDIRVVSGVSSWEDIRACLQAGGWDSVGTIVLDSVTLAEQLCVAWVIKNVRHPDKPETAIRRLEDYGWGRGLGYVYDEFLALLSDLEIHLRAGRHAILIAHDCVTECPNPAGPNYLRYEPRLQAPASGKNSVRLRVREWADHCLYLSFDTTVVDGKGQGAGTRTLYPSEQAWFMAKSRTADTAMPVPKNDPSVWSQIIC